MIPGFLSQVLNTPAEMLNDFLPEPFEVTYVDSFKFGKPHEVLGQALGYSELAFIRNDPAKTFIVTLRQRGTHGFALVDRIE